MRPTVVVCVPSGGDWKALFGISLAHMFTYEALRREFDVALLSSRGSILPNLREAFLEKAEKMGAQWLLYIDSDMQFPPTTLQRLMDAKVGVIGCACATKEIPSFSTAWETPQKVLYLPECRRRVQRVWRVGTGVLLVKVSILKSLPAPRFPMEFRPSRGLYQGEDWGFCDRLDAAGIPIYVETQLSKEIGHVGDFTYGYVHVPKVADVDPEDPVAAARFSAQLELELFDAS